MPLLSSLLVAPARLGGAQTPPATGAQAPSREELLWLKVPEVISPSKRPQPLTRAPSTTTVITAEDIRRSGATNIVDLLRKVPGLDIFQVSASDVNITARGLNQRLSHRMQVFIDGRSVYEDALNLVYWHELPISLSEIERIEIVTSPASALFGANAFSGLIHIITKSPDALKGTLISETVGNAGTTISEVIQADIIDKLAYKAVFAYDRTNQFPNPLIGRTRDQKGRDDFRGNVLAEYRFSRGSRLSLSGGVDSFSRDIDPGLIPQTTRISADGSVGFVKLNYSHGDFKSQFLWDRFDLDMRSSILPPETNVLANTYKLDLQHSFHLGNKNVLTGGAGYRFNTYDSPALTGPERRQNMFSLFLQNEYSPRQDVTLTFGLRVDTHPEAGVSVSPRVSVVYSTSEHRAFRLSISRAFRNPSVLENFVNFGIPTPLGTIAILGNRDLKAEQITSFEGGYQTLLVKRVKARLDLFYNRAERLNTGPVATTNPLVRTLFTGGGTSIFGGEIGGEFLLTLRVKGFMNYSYQHRDTTNPLLGIGPNHKGNAGLYITLPKGLETDVFLNSVGENTGFPSRVPSYTTMNLRLGYQFGLMGAKGALNLGVSNLFDDRHREFPDGDIIERRITWRLQFKF